jgi:predicted peroxiredoxin
MAQPQNLLIIVNTTTPYNQYAPYVVAFMAKKLGNVPNVTIFYGPEGMRMSRKGELAKLALTAEVKELVASQIDGLSAGDLPDNLEQLARFVSGQLGVTVASCATFHVIDGFAKSVDHTANIEDFIVPIKLPQAWEAVAAADKVLCY